MKSKANDTKSLDKQIKKIQIQKKALQKIIKGLNKNKIIN